MKMKIKLKLFAGLARYLPGGARQNAVDLEVSEGTTIAVVLDSVGVPRESIKLIFIDGIHQFPEELDRRTLQPGEVLALWPPVAGG